MLPFWKPVKDYEGIYIVSDKGDVKVLQRTWISGKGARRYNPERLLKQQTSRGYKRVCLIKEGNKKTFSVHRLVAQAFIANPESKPEINHIDGNPGNNRVKNLEWVTASENQKHAFKIGLNKAKRGQDNKLSKLTNSQVVEIRSSQLSGRKLAEVYRVDPMTISRVRRKATYNI